MDKNSFPTAVCRDVRRIPFAVRIILPEYDLESAMYDLCIQKHINPNMALTH